MKYHCDMCNYKKIVFHGIVLFACIMISSSCEKFIILDLPDQQGKYLIVEGNIDNLYNTQEIRLYSSGSYYDTEKGLFVSGARVSMTDGISEFVFTEGTDDRWRGHYFNSKIKKVLEAGGIYRLTVDFDGRIYTAESELRPVPEIDSITVIMNFLSGIGVINEPMYDVYVHFRNLPVTGNYYLINLFINESNKSFTPPRKTVISDENLKGPVSLYARTLRNLKEGDTLRLEMRSISRKQYEFYNGFLSQTELSGNPFAGAPPANLPTNLSEGARGFFQVSAATTRTKIFKPQKNSLH
jgi:hypothetical protein